LHRGKNRPLCRSAVSVSSLAGRRRGWRTNWPLDERRNRDTLCAPAAISSTSVMTQPIPTTRPLVNVVTPFYNAATYLAECIESALAQGYADFEYVLMDNCSTDGSYNIAAAYTAHDPRIRLFRCSEFLAQLPNHGRAFLQISSASKYCKIQPRVKPRGRRRPFNEES
jgi:cellulose synthase/poly-beta-1,6-N-acetylglucosamine synthase-like glycosyltransferase